MCSARAAALDPDVAAVLVGDDQLAPLAGDAGRHGAATVFTVVDAYPSPLPGPRIDVLAELVRSHGFDTILFSNSVLAADVAAGLAARLDAGINWDLVDLEARDGEPIGKQPMLQDSVLAEVGWRSPQRVALFRPGCVRTGADVGRASACGRDAGRHLRRAHDRGARHGTDVARPTKVRRSPTPT